MLMNSLTHMILLKMKKLLLIRRIARPLLFRKPKVRNKKRFNLKITHFSLKHRKKKIMYLMLSIREGLEYDIDVYE